MPGEKCVVIYNVSIFPCHISPLTFILFDFLAGGDDGAEGDDNDDAGSDQDFAG